MNNTDLAFQKAWQRATQSPALKLLNPGVQRLVTRWMARRQGEPRYHTVPLFFGTEMTVVLPEIISEAIYTYGMFDEIVTWVATQAVKPGNVVFDVGAHFGYFSLLFAHLAGGGGKVYSFEPTPSTYEVLARNAGRAANITALNAAAGAEPGQMKIADFGLKHSAWNTLAAESRMPDSLHAVSARHLTVDVTTLDAFAQAQGVMPDFIKIDAENFEHAVIAGATAILERNAPVVLMESGSASVS